MAFITNRSKKHKSTSPIAIQVKNGQNTISDEEKSDIISWLEKGERIVDTGCTFHIHTVHLDIIKVFFIIIYQQMCKWNVLKTILNIH